LFAVVGTQEIKVTQDAPFQYMPAPQLPVPVVQDAGLAAQAAAATQAASQVDPEKTGTPPTSV